MTRTVVAQDERSVMPIDHLAEMCLEKVEKCINTRPAAVYRAA